MSFTGLNRHPQHVADIHRHTQEHIKTDLKNKKILKSELPQDLAIALWICTKN